MTVIDRRNATVSATDAPASTSPNAGLAIKTPVRVASTVNIDLQTFGLGVMDAVQLVAGDRALLKNQTDATQNGIYQASSGVWQRARDMGDNSQVASHLIVSVANGTLSADEAYTLTTQDPILLGTTSLAFDFFRGNVISSVGVTDNAVVRYDGTTGHHVQGSLVTINDAGFLDTPSGLRARGIAAPTTGTGMEIGWDGSQGVLQAIAYPSLAPQPILYVGSNHKWRVNGSDVMELNAFGDLGIGVAAGTTARLDVRPPQTFAGSRLFAISNDQNLAVSGAFGPVNLTWGSSNGAPWDASGYTGDNEVLQIYSYSKADTHNFRPLHITGHLTAGTSAAIVGALVQAYIDSTTTTPRGGTGLEVLMRNDSAVGDIWGTNIGIDYTVTSTTAAVHGTEYDISARGATIKYKFGMVIGSTQADVAVVTGTLSVNGSADTVPGSAAYWVTSFGGGGAGSAIGFDSAILTMKETSGGTPITGRLWYAGGFTVPVGLDWGRMGFSDAAIKLPNNAPIKAYNAAGSATFSLIGLNTSNLIALGTGATINPTSGGAVLGGSTIVNAMINGTAGGGYVQFVAQSSKPSTPTGAVNVYTDVGNGLAWQTQDGFARIFSGTLTANRTYTFPDATGTIALTGTNTRTILTGNTTYFVRTDGNDSNTGLVNSAGGAFLTLQKAANVIFNTLDLAGFNVLVSVANGAYSAGIAITSPQVGIGTVTFQGNTGTPSSVTITSTGADALKITNCAAATFTGFKLVTVTSGNHINADMGAQVTLGVMEYGTSSNDHIVASHGAMVYVNGNETISGGASGHWHAGNNAQIQVGGVTVTTSGTPAFSAEFAGTSSNGTIFVLGGTTFAGTGATGQRYLAHTGGYINTQSASSSDTFLPGSVAGTAFDGGFYNSTQFTTGMDVPATIRATGLTTPASGSGLEIGFDGSNGVLQAVNHTGSAFLPIIYSGATSHTFKLAGSTVATLTPSSFALPGLTFGGSTMSVYQTGTWTPADSSGASLAFTSVSGGYTRIGNMVFAYGRVTYPSTVSGAGAAISGLPYTSANTTYSAGPGSVYASGGNTNANSLLVNQNNTTFGILKASGAGALNSDLSLQTLIFSVVYPVS